MKPTILIEGDSDVGSVRTANEDTYGIFEPPSSDLLVSRGRLVIVSDGMGGAVGGATASALVVQAVQECYFSEGLRPPTEALRHAVTVANERVYGHAAAHPELRGMGATCTAVAIFEDAAALAHVGDSRAYLIRDHRILALTDDHSRVAQLLRDGHISAEEAEHREDKNVLQRVLGPKASVEVDGDSRRLDLKDGDRLLLCSDGLHGLVRDVELLEILESKGPKEAVAALIRLANERGGPDNITAVVCAIGTAAIGPGRRAAPATNPPSGTGSGGAPLRGKFPLALAVGGVAVILGAAGYLGLTIFGSRDEDHAAANSAGPVEGGKQAGEESLTADADVVVGGDDAGDEGESDLTEDAGTQSPGGGPPGDSEASGGESGGGPLPNTFKQATEPLKQKVREVGREAEKGLQEGIGAVAGGSSVVRGTLRPPAQPNDGEKANDANTTDSVDEKGDSPLVAPNGGPQVGPGVDRLSQLTGKQAESAMEASTSFLEGKKANCPRAIRRISEVTMIDGSKGNPIDAVTPAWVRALDAFQRHEGMELETSDRGVLGKQTLKKLEPKLKLADLQQLCKKP